MDSESESDKSESSSDSDSEDDQLSDIVHVSSPVCEAQAHKKKQGGPHHGDPQTLLSGIAYIPSYVLKNPKPILKLLESEKAWKKLVKGVELHIEESTKKGKGAVKEFSIQIVDTFNPSDPKKAVAVKKGKTNKEEAPAVSTREQQFYRELEQKYHCAEHGKPCAVLLEGTHYNLTNTDLSKWVYLISQGRATKLELSCAELKIDDVVPRQHTAKKGLAQTRITASNSSEPPEWMRYIMPFMGMALGSPAVQPQPMAGPSCLFPPIFDLPSSGTKRAASAAAPTLDNWLLTIDNDKTGCGRHSTCFSQYALKLEDNGIFDLTDMEGIEAKELTSMLEAPIGIANCLVKYTKEDMDKITNAVKRLRRS
ncbi:hypothetical protein DFH07DRAFT_771243 [Mycena maculata]|uniref:Uncharacterized protein n=1 Tax=Mycena maculata TaxID=230809 RepID=A0AAD7NI09_9AGAR|nr:hypothetical protein DFH07DRAFT_771243 [Mycena maculata]